MAQSFENIKNSTKALIKRGFRRIEFFKYWNFSYSLEGQDRILLRLFDGRRNGFYVDIGAHHPRKFSNTTLLYKQGWSGCNIEAHPELLEIFKKERPRDINLNIGVSDTQGELNYCMFEEPAFNKLEDLKNPKEDHSKHLKPLGVRKIQVDRLDNILRKMKSEKKLTQRIDLFNIDVENHEWEVLNSNDWQEFKPEVISIEVHAPDLEALMSHRNYIFLTKLGYKLVAKTPMTCFFKVRI